MNLAAAQSFAIFFFLVGFPGVRIRVRWKTLLFAFCTPLSYRSKKDTSIFPPPLFLSSEPSFPSKWGHIFTSGPLLRTSCYLTCCWCWTCCFQANILILLVWVVCDCEAWMCNDQECVSRSTLKCLHQRDSFSFRFLRLNAFILSTVTSPYFLKNCHFYTKLYDCDLVMFSLFRVFVTRLLFFFIIFNWLHFAGWWWKVLISCVGWWRSSELPAEWKFILSLPGVSTL